MNYFAMTILGFALTEADWITRINGYFFNFIQHKKKKDKIIEMAERLKAIDCKIYLHNSTHRVQILFSTNIKFLNNI